MNIPLPSKESLLEKLIYYPSTGDFIWKERIACNAKDRLWNEKYAGQQAGVICKKNGYRKVCIKGTHYRANRIAWRISTGNDPGELCIDHIDGNKANDAIKNLRAVTHHENMRNRGKQSNNSSGMKGVYWHRRDKKWIAKVCVNRNVKQLGRFETAEEACEAYRKGCIEMHGEFANYGEPRNAYD